MSKKIAQIWAENFLNSEEGKLEKEKLNQEFKDYILFGKSTRYLNEPLIDEMDGFITTKEMTIEEIVERFSLSDKEKEDLIKLRDNGKSR
jgi:hypothetical protein